MAKFWVAIESKTFEVSIEEIKGKLKGIIVERSRGFSSWIRFGASGLRKLLECFEECCREEKKGRLVKVWEEEGRKFRLERRVNGAGRYVLCSVVDVEAKRFCLVFPEGKGVIGGWAILAVKLRALGIVTKKDDKGVEATQISSKKKDATIDDEEERCSGKKKQGEIRSFLDVAKGPAGRVGEELWLQVGGRGLRRREEVLGRCLVGRWEGAVMEMELDSLKNWGKRSWNLRKGVKVMKMGEPFFLLEFEDEGEAERVLNRGTRRFKDRLLHLERWNEEAGCLRDGNQTKEVWVRVVGLPLHCWSEEMFKSIGDCCGGLVGVDEATKNLSQLQWARILVKNNGNFFPGTLNLVVKSFCYAVRLWWEVQPRVSAVEPMMNLRRKEGERMREKGDEQSRAGNSGGKEKEGWRAAGADGSGAVRKRKGKEKCDGDKIGVSVEGLAGYSKKEGEVGSSEKDGVEGLDSCKCGCEVTQPSNCQRLEHESTEVWVENQKVINGSRARWEKGQSSRGGEWAAHEGPLSVKKKFLGQMDNRGEKWASRVDIPLLQRDGLGLLDNRPKVVEKDGQDDGPSSFQKDGLGRLEHRSRVAGGEGQPILASVWAPSAYKSPWDELSVNARASSCLEPAEEFFAEDSLIGGMGPAAAIGTPERCSITDECFLEEASRFKTLGAPDPHRPHEDIAFSVARFFQKGGSLQNYYMYHGGTNFGRTSGGPFITTSYDYNAPIDEYGLARLPKWGHLKELHRAIKSCEHVLLYGEPINLSLGPSQEVDVYTDSSGGCAAFISNVDEKEDKIIMFQNVSYHVPAWSVSILPDCKNVVFNTAKVGSQTSQVEMVPEELQPSLVPSNKDLKGLQWETFVEKAGIWGEADFVKNGFVDHINTTKDTTDYLWYTVSLTVGESENFLKEISQPVLLVESKGHALHAFVNQKLQGSASGNGSHSPFKFECPISLKAGKNDIALLSMTVGLQNAGPFYEWVGAGLTSVKIKGLNNGIMDLSTYTWTYKIGLQGEHLLIYKPEGLNSVKWLSTPEPPKQQPLTWYKAVVDPPSGNEPIGLDMVHMGKGLAWLNGEEIGRYWPRKSSIHDKCVQECDYRGKFMPNKCSTGCGEPTQRWYHVPRSWFKPSGNILVIFEEKGGDPTKIRFSRRKTTGVCALVSEDHPTYELESWHKDANENNKNKATIHLKCPENTHISSVKFASYGTPTGKCGSYSQGDCHDPNSASVVEKLCIRKNDCAIELAEKNFSKDLCPSRTKKLAVEAVCS